MEQTVKCPICSEPYVFMSHYAGDQSACPKCVAKARKEKFEFREQLEEREVANEDIDALTQILSIFDKKMQYKDNLCNVCWTSSYAPCKQSHPDAQKVKGKDAWVVCQMCLADKRMIEFDKEKKKFARETKLLAKRIIELSNENSCLRAKMKENIKRGER